jgi:hypothetical protein
MAGEGHAAYLAHIASRPSSEPRGTPATAYQGRQEGLAKLPWRITCTNLQQLSSYGAQLMVPKWSAVCFYSGTTQQQLLGCTNTCMPALLPACMSSG